MRLSDVLSKEPATTMTQVEGFLGDRRMGWGKHKMISVGKVARNFFCKPCNEMRTFLSGDKISCLIAGEHAVSIDATLKCSLCSSSVEAWFLVSIDGDIHSRAVDVRLERYTANLHNIAGRAGAGSGEFMDLLERAQTAYEAQLGAGSMIYLRKLFEAITTQVADVAGIGTIGSSGRRRPFRELLEEVDTSYHIIPERFSSNGYRLFSELSEVIHGDSDEKEALRKYLPCRHLVLSVVDKVKVDNDLSTAISALGWDVGDLEVKITEELKA